METTHNLQVQRRVAIIFLYVSLTCCSNELQVYLRDDLASPLHGGVLQCVQGKQWKLNGKRIVESFEETFTCKNHSGKAESNSQIIFCLLEWMDSENENLSARSCLNSLVS